MITDDRLREIAAREYGPNRQEWEAMASELIGSRAAFRDLGRYAKDESVESHFPDLAAAIRRAAAAVTPSDAASETTDPAPGTRVRVTTGDYQGFVGAVQPREEDDPPGWSRVKSEGRWQETRLFQSESLAPV